MTPTPITNKAMYAFYDPKGNIVFPSIEWTKEDSERKFMKDRGHSLREYKLKGFECKMIAVDIVVID